MPNTNTTIDRRLSRFLRGALLGALVAFVSGCGTLPNGQRWGANATLRPGWGHVRDAAVDALTDPQTWVPAVGALAFQIDTWDEDVSDWAVDHTPVFGSTEDASEWSYDLEGVTDVAYVLTALQAPSGDEPMEWLAAKAKGFAVGFSAILIRHDSVDYLKEAVGRTRPDESNDRSFPSGHASSAGVNAALAARNLQYGRAPESVRRVGAAAIHTAAWGTGWARVESGVHYPSDVLAGLAWGHFLGVFINDAFMGFDEDLSAGIVPVEKGAQLAIAWRF